MMTMSLEFVCSFIAAITIAAVFWNNRVVAVAAVAALLPTYVIRFSIAGIPMTMFELLILAVFSILVVDILFRSKKTALRFARNRKTLFLSSMIVLLLLATVFGLLTTPNVRTGLGIAKAYVIEPILLFVIIIQSIRTQKDIALIMGALIASASVIALIAIIQYMAGWSIPYPWHDLPNRRATAVYGYPNAVGLYIAPIVTVAIAYAIHFKKELSQKKYALLLTSIVLCIAALFASQVEGALIAVAAATGVLLLCTKYHWYTFAAGAVGILLALLVEPTRRILLFQDVSGDVRLALWKGTWNLLQHQPVFGSGLGGFPATYDIYRLPSHVELLLYPHNILFDFWTQLGLLGAVWIVILFCIGFVYLLYIQRHATDQLTKKYTYLFLGLMTCVVIYGLVDVVYFKNDLSALFWIWVACILACTNPKQHKKNIDAPSA